MKFRELGKAENPVVILLHGEGLSWWSAEEAGRLLQKQYHIILPILDGHGEAGGTAFTGIADSAEKLIRFADRRFGGHVFAVCGLSLGGQIAARAIAERPDFAEYAVLESVLVQPGYGQNDRIPSFPARFFLFLMRGRPFAELQAKFHSIPKELFGPFCRDFRKISLTSFQKILGENRNFRLPANLGNTKAKVLILVGSGESAERKLSAGLLKKAIPGSRLTIARGMRRGELSIAHSEEYVHLLEQWFSGKKGR